MKSYINDAPSADAIPDAVATFLNSTLSLEHSLAAKVLNETKVALGVADSGLPAEPAIVHDHASAKDARHPVLTTDIHAWKAGMQLSTGVQPVRNLEFVEILEKL